MNKCIGIVPPTLERDQTTSLEGTADVARIDPFSHRWTSRSRGDRTVTKRCKRWPSGRGWWGAERLDRPLPNGGNGRLAWLAGRQPAQGGCRRLLLGILAPAARVGGEVPATAFDEEST